MKTIIGQCLVLGSFISGIFGVGVSANAATVTCAEMQKAAQENLIRSNAFNSQLSNDLGLMVSLFKKSLVLEKAESQSTVAQKSIETLIERYDPQFKVVRIAGKKFQAVNLSLGDNPYIYYFDFDLENFSGIVSKDGSVEVDGKYCDLGDLNVL